MGMLYQRGEVWWIKYYVNGRAIRESARTEKKKLAERFLRDREGRVAMGAPALPKVERIRFSEIADALVEHYRVTGRRQLREVETKLKPVRAFFDHDRLVGINQQRIMAYIIQRQAAGLTNATINRGLSLLGTALRLAHERGQLVRVPRIHMLEESDPRAGFFERAEFEKVRQHLRPDLALAITIDYTYGWRTQSEVLTLPLCQVDLEAGTLRLEPGTTKNGEGRTVYLTPELHVMLMEQIERVKALSQRLKREIPYLFPNPNKGRHFGERLRDFRAAWNTACKNAGLVGMIRHDFRRTAVRNLVRAGVPESVAQRVTGHKSRSVFNRYDIVSDQDMREATKKLAGHRTGTKSPSEPLTPLVSI